MRDEEGELAVVLYRVFRVSPTEKVTFEQTLDRGGEVR